MKIKRFVMTLGLIATAFLFTAGQEVGRYAIKQSYPLELKRTDSLASLSRLVRVEGAPWLRLHVADYKLRNDDYITITSLTDRSRQRLDAKSLPEWRNNSAYFNGSAVQIELNTANPDSFVKITEITVGLIQPPPYQPDTICGTNDDRTAIVDPPVGRLNLLNDGINVSNPLCTAWAVSNGTFLTAGHCVDFDPDGTGPLLPDGVPEPRFINGVVEFNVPASQPNGTTVFSNANDQYPVNQVTWAYGGAATNPGLEFGVFSVSANSNTGLLPHPSRGFYRMTDEIPAANSENVRVSGYGQDNTPTGTTGSWNAQHTTLQTHTGTYLGRTQDGGTRHDYSVDTTPGNSGSPIVWSNNPLFTIGIHTDGGCTSTGGANQGTGFGHDPLEAALQTFWGANSIYVDSAAYPNLSAVQRNGSIFRPHSTLGNGLAGTATGGNLLLTPNTYTGVTTFNRAMTIRAPAGTATIIP